MKWRKRLPETEVEAVRGTIEAATVRARALMLVDQLNAVIADLAEVIETLPPEPEPRHDRRLGDLP